MVRTRSSARSIPPVCPLSRRRVIVGWRTSGSPRHCWPNRSASCMLETESDIYELFCTARDAGTHFLVRTCVDRLAGDGRHTIADEMQEVRVQGLHRIEVRNKKGERSEAALEIRYRRIKVLPPIGKQKRYPNLELTVIHATERGTPEGRNRARTRRGCTLRVGGRR